MDKYMVHGLDIRDAYTVMQDLEAWKNIQHIQGYPVDPEKIFAETRLEANQRGKYRRGSYWHNEKRIILNVHRFQSGTDAELTLIHEMCHAMLAETGNSNGSGGSTKKAHGPAFQKLLIAASVEYFGITREALVKHYTNLTLSRKKFGAYQLDAAIKEALIEKGSFML